MHSEGSDLSQRARVLLLDDGELGRIRGMLRDLDVDLEHLRGAVSSSDLLEGAYDVVFASVRSTLAFEGELDLGDLPGKPVWIAAHGQDFLPLRVRLRKLGVQFLIQSSVGSEALQLLIRHTLQKAPDKRGVLRLPVGCPVRCSGADGSSFPTQLLDLSQGGCRILSTQQFEVDERLSVELPEKLAGGEACTLPGRVVRKELRAPEYLLGVEFDDLPASSLEVIQAILAGKVIGTVVTRLSEELTEEVAALGLTPRSAADAAPVQDVPPDPSPSAPPEPEPDPKRRRNRRVEYTREVTALLGPGEHVILARDLSIEGMRPSPCPSSRWARGSSWRSTALPVTSRSSCRPRSAATMARAAPSSISIQCRAASASAWSESSPRPRRSAPSAAASRTRPSSLRAGSDSRRNRQAAARR